jgi:hypothetical protein
MASRAFRPDRARANDGAVPRCEPGIVRAERIVGFGFRRGMCALEQRDALGWELCWQDFANVAGPESATSLVAGLSQWVRAVRRCAGRRIETFPAGCPGFCRDECLAISMIAASQQNACPALRACAFALLGSNDLDEPLRTARGFAEGLAGAGQLLSQQSVCDSLSFLPAAGGHRN